MGRECRRVPPNWKHPKDRPLYDTFRKRREELSKWEEGFVLVFGGEWRPKDSGLESMTAEDYFGPSDPEDFMPDWPLEVCTHLQMYETTTEGTPISPVMATAAELARWLADNKASAFGEKSATYEQWLRTIQADLSSTAIFTGAVSKNGGPFEPAIASLQDELYAEAGLDK